jgi:polyphosphate kinase
MLPRCDRNAPVGGAIGERLQHWVKEHGLKVVLVFEGRDAAGKGGTIKRLTLNPRGSSCSSTGSP